MILYLLHSPYPDQTFRGLEKCVPEFFFTPEDAWEVLVQRGLQSEFRVIEVHMGVPDIRSALIFPPQPDSYEYGYKAGYKGNPRPKGMLAKAGWADGCWDQEQGLDEDPSRHTNQ